ncbi:MAG: 3-deoxy-D-manno-octulosonic acid kinase [Gammaproteobacteria bacterium]
MAERTVTTKWGFILYDDALTNHAGEELFSPHHWVRHSSLRGAVGGRGNTWIVERGEQSWVLRHYRRGGLVRYVSRDYYLWRGLESTRPWREWKLLAELYREGLPVPQPVAAQVTLHGPAYRGDLITRLIPDTRSLAAHLQDTRIEALPWNQIGICIRRFHNAGVYHADLNAHNILINSHNDVYLVDFDRGEQRSPSVRWQEANLKRLLRSLRKLPVPDLTEDGYAWEALLGGYNNTPGVINRAVRP